MAQPASQVEISRASYGKDGVRVLAWSAPTADGAVRDVRLDLHVEGDFLASYRSGDNTAVLPSDTLRRHALSACEGQPAAPVEELLDVIAARILDANPAVATVTAVAQIQVWQRLGGSAFLLAPWRRLAELSVRRGQLPRRQGGVTGLHLLTTSGSSFAGFLHDRFTTQVDAFDRPLCGTLDASWTYVGEQRPDPGVPEEVVSRLQAAFVDRPSNAIQQLLTSVGGEVLASTAELASIELRFASLPVGAVPPDLPGLAGTNTYEIGSVPVGITCVTLRRPA